MTRLLIIKVGDAPPHIRARRGDYDEWIRVGCGVDAAEVLVVDPRRGDDLPAPDAAAGIVVTGSSALVTDRDPWSERTAQWLTTVIDADRPLLGICYGHQLIAHGLGGRVARNPRGREIGSIDVDLTDAARDDALFGRFEGPLRTQATHVESVVELPPGATRLGHNALDPNQAFSLGTRAWGVQFHPEFDAEIVGGYIDKRREAIAGEGLDPDALLNATRDSDDGTSLLRRFATFF